MGSADIHGDERRIELAQRRQQMHVHFVQSFAVVTEPIAIRQRKLVGLEHLDRFGRKAAGEQSYGVGRLSFRQHDAQLPGAQVLVVR